MILDYELFLNESLVISLPILHDKNKKEVFNLDTNFSVYFFMKLYATQQELAKSDIELDEAIKLLKDIAVKILNLDKQKNITLQDVNKKFDDFYLLNNLFGLVINHCRDLYDKEIYRLPNIKVKRKVKTNKYIDLISSDDFEAMEGFTLVMKETSNSLTDIYRMSYASYLLILKHIRLSTMLQDEEWREEYIKWKYKTELKKGNVNEQTKLDKEGLKRLSGLL